MKNDEWLTDPEILRKLGSFDLDPCSPVNRPWDTAKLHYDKIQNGLVKPWQGRVWCNPPYGKEAAEWLDKLKIHNYGTALIFARTETSMFFDHVWNAASALLFIKGRLHFYNVEGMRAPANSGGPSVLISYGIFDAFMLEHSGIPGKFLRL